jgi:hypothetical protein
MYRLWLGMHNLAADISECKRLAVVACEQCLRMRRDVRANQVNLVGGYCPRGYVNRRVWVTMCGLAQDGCQVQQEGAEYATLRPVALVHTPDFEEFTSFATTCSRIYATHFFISGEPI